MLLLLFPILKVRNIFFVQFALYYIYYIILFILGHIPDEVTAMSLVTSGPLPAAAGSSPLGTAIPIAAADEIQRTIYIGNLDPVVTGEQLMQFFTTAGEIKYVRMGGDETPGIKCAYIEFSSLASISKALQFNGSQFGSKSVR